MVKGYARYSQAYKSTQVTTADQGRLIVMLYDGAIGYLQRAAERIKADDGYGANKNLIKGKSIIAELMASLNMEQGGDIAVNLRRLYTYMFSELIDANLTKDSDRVNHVVELLKELRQGWHNISGGDKVQEPELSRGRVKGINVRG